MTTEQADILDESFTHLLDGCRIGSIRATDARQGLEKVSGCYVWIMRFDRSRFVIYVGRTNSILRRVNDYSGAFQIQSPNDFKMRLVEEVLAEQYAGAIFDLYFLPLPETECTPRERELIAQFRPMVNSLPKPNSLERSAIESAYRSYYRSAIARQATDDT